MSRSLRKNRFFSRTLPTLGVLATLGLITLSGCDTVARISFPDVKFDRIEVAGLTPPADSCEGSSGPAKLRFILLDNQKRPITPETTLKQKLVTLSKSSVSFDQTAVFTTPDETCDGACEQSGFTCDAAHMSFTDASLNRCFLPGGSGIGVQNAPTFRSSLTVNQLFGVVMEKTGTLTGKLPSSLTVLYPDLDGDGKGDSLTEVQGVRPERASDPSGFRVVGLSQIASTWKTVAELSSKNHLVQNFFSIWTFGNSSAALTPLFGNDVWTSSPAAVARTVKDFNATTNSAQASVFESVSSILKDKKAYADPVFADYEKILVLFVDGPDDLRLKTQTADTVIAAAKAVNAKLFIVHLDPAIQTETSSGDPLFIDDPVYVQTQDGCMEDSECKNFEVCRKITNFSTTLGGSVSIPDESKKDLKFCLPKRDKNGRIGPIDDYSKMACATGGSYVYVNDFGSLPQAMSWLPYALDGLWEVDVNVDPFSRGLVEDGQPYLFQGNLSVNLGGVDTSKILNQKGNFQKDNRLVLFKNK